MHIVKYKSAFEKEILAYTKTRMNLENMLNGIC